MGILFPHTSIPSHTMLNIPASVVSRTFRKELTQMREQDVLTVAVPVEESVD